MKLTREQALEILRELNVTDDPEADYAIAHMNADRTLLNLIDDAEITEAFNNVPKWYS
jgi:hypothetical protein